MQNQTNSKYSSNPRDIFKSVKKTPPKIENLTLKRNP